MDTSEILNDSLSVGLLLEQTLPGMIQLYQKIEQNNQNAGLTPAADLLNDALGIGADIETTADAEIAANEPKDGTAPQAPAQTGGGN